MNEQWKCWKKMRRQTGWLGKIMLCDWEQINKSDARIFFEYCLDNLKEITTILKNYKWFCNKINLERT